MIMRLDKFLALSRTGTRSEVKDYIRKGRVTVGGAVAHDPAAKVSTSDEVLLDGKRIVYREHVYYMLNKPAGTVSATEDPDEKTVIDLFPEDMRKGLFPVGRLDKDSVGLLIITDDGDLSHRITSPKNHIDKRYLIRTDAALDEEDAAAFAGGITLGDGTECAPARLEISAESREAVVVISEGKYHQVKRMIASRGKKVQYLKRLSIGGLRLDEALPEGEYRELTDDELRRIFDPAEHLTVEKYKEIYEILENIGPADHDCGEHCGSICCSDSSFEDEDSYIYLLPGEKEYLESEGSDMHIERQRRDEHDLPKSWGDYVYIAKCPGKEKCDRRLRPIQCRTFPLHPYISDSGELEMVLYYMDVPYSCPFVEKEIAVSDDFRRAAHRAWAKLIEDKAVRDLVVADSKERNTVV